MSIFIFLGLIISIYLIRFFVYRKFILKKNYDNYEELKENQKVRLQSLDVFRGISLFLMIFVNLWGGMYWYFNHSTWNGLTFADLPFGWFIWIMGSTMALTLDKINKSFKLFLLGVFLINNCYDFKTMRIPGVLQRIGFSYLVVGFIVTFIPKIEIKNSFLSMHKDIFNYIYQWLFAIILLTNYLLITFLTKIDQCDQGYIGPGGKYSLNNQECTGGIARKIDLFLFGDNHIFQSPTCQALYQCQSFDPEGALGSLTSIFLAYMGYSAGRIVKSYQNYQIIKRLLFWGIFYLILGGSLCGFSQNEGLIPINKNLWSISYIFVTGGFAFIFLSILYYFIDQKKIYSGWPFKYLGMNSIAIYLVSEIFVFYFPISFKNDGSHQLMLLSNSIGLISMIILSYIMFKNGIFLKV